MRFEQLNIQNFLTIGSAALVLDNRGLVLVQGENADDSSADSNGAGKSSIPDALCWTLYGKTARGESGNSVINSKAKKNCRVSVRVTDGSDTWMITRHRKFKGKSNRLEVELIDPTTGTVTRDLTKGTDKLTQEVVEKIIGCSYEVFAASVYAGQEAMPDLPSMTDKQLKVLVEEAAGITRLQAAHEEARSRLRDAEHTLKNTAHLCGSEEAHIRRLVDEYKANQVKKEEFDEEHHRKLVAAKKNLKHAKKDLETVMERSEAIHAEVPANVDEEIKKLDAQIAGVTKENDRLNELTEELRQADYARREAERAADDRVGKANQIKDEIKKLDEKVGEPCPTCGKAYCEEDMGDVKTRATEKLKETIEEAKKLRTAVAEANVKIGKAREALDAFKASMTDISEATIKRRQLESLKVKAEGAAENVKLYRKAVEDEERRVDEVMKETNPYIVILEGQKKNIEASKERIVALREQCDALKGQIATLKDAVTVFGPAGVRAHILDTVTPYLNDRTAHYLGALSDGNITAVWNTIGETAAGELREKFNIDVKNEKGAESFGGLSGGEKRKVRLAVAMALQDLVASRATKPIELFIADEVDHALDESGLERLMNLLNEKAADRGTVLVISHNALTDWIRDTITVTKKGGQSFVEGAIAA